MRTMRHSRIRDKQVLWSAFAVAGLGLAMTEVPVKKAVAQTPSSYAPVVVGEDFEATMARMKAAKARVMKKQLDLLEERYDMSNRPASGVTMSRGKAVQEGVRVKLPSGVAWESLAEMAPEEIREKGLFPKGFLPLPHPNHPEGGMVFPQHHIDEIKRQEGRDLIRFDLDYDLPEHFLAEYPQPKLDIFGKLDANKATESELRGQQFFFDKSRCAECHPAPYYTDNLMHNLRTERFFKPQMVNGRKAVGDGPIKTFPLRGIKDSPPCLHDRRLLTLEDTVEFFNLITGVKLTKQEKHDLVAFLRCL